MAIDNYSAITEKRARQQRRIANCLRQSGRKDEVILLAVSKAHTLSAIRTAYAAGQKDFGENYLQEALPKMAAMQEQTDICWHYIGRVQSNKTRLIAEHFDWVQSVASLKAARRLDTQRPSTKPPLNICVQVNISDEDTKGGCLPQDVEALCGRVAQLAQLRLRGLMTIARQTEDQTLLRQDYARMHALFTNIGVAMPACWDTLSMGMSADLEMAIQQGATMVRLGTAIFGARPTTR